MFEIGRNIMIPLIYKLGFRQEQNNRQVKALICD